MSHLFILSTWTSSNWRIHWLYGAKPFLRSWLFLSWSKRFPKFMEYEGSSFYKVVPTDTLASWIQECKIWRFVECHSLRQKKVQEYCELFISLRGSCVDCMIVGHYCSTSMLFVMSQSAVPKMWLTYFRIQNYALLQDQHLFNWISLWGCF
jgi:hypothetical protein